MTGPSDETRPEPAARSTPTEFELRRTPIDPTPLPPSVRALRRLGRALALLPARARRAIAGAPIVRRGAELDVQVQAIVRLARTLASKPVHGLSVTDARRALDRDARILEPEAPSISQAYALTVAGADRRLDARLYMPTLAQAQHAPPPLLVYFHGGGWVVGSLDSHDAVCRNLGARAGCAVLSVAYRLAPEHPFPTPVRDALAAYRDAAARAASWGCDPTRLAVGGDSAGGNLAALVALAVKREPSAPRLQLLFYPGVDLTMQNPSITEFGEGFLLEHASLTWYLDRYLPERAQRADPGASPLHTREADLAGAPAAHVQTAGFDPLQDEAVRYAQKLRAAGVQVEHQHYAGLVHGYLGLALVVEAAQRAYGDAVRALRAAFA